MKIRIVTDSTCDLPESIIDQYGIKVIPLYINIGSRSYRDGIDLTRQEFYNHLPEYNPPPTTATPGMEAFCQVYEQLSAEGATQVLSIHISISLSATVDVARTAAQAIKTVPVTVLDSRQLSMGTGFLVEAAAKAAIEGRTMDEILMMTEDQISRTHAFAALDTVEFLRRSGRMSWSLAGLASLLRIKPLLKMYNGHPTSERVRTRSRATRKLISLLTEVSPLERVALVHTNAPEKADSLRQQVLHLLPQGEVPSVNITPVLGAHIGPGVVGFACIRARA
jgi:DegV family protein with EDD domain